MFHNKNLIQLHVNKSLSNEYVHRYEKLNKQNNNTHNELK